MSAGEIVEEVAPGVLRASIPIPGALGHANAWLLRDADGWTLVDCGSDSAEGRAAWDHLAAGILADAPVKRILVTHAHHDHIGLAGPLSRRFGAPVATSPGEWAMAEARLREGDATRAEARRFYARLGVEDDAIPALIESRAKGTSHMTDLPQDRADLAGGTELELAGSVWQVFATGGHSPEALVFLGPRPGLLIVGDMLLPRISPFIGVGEQAPLADPLTEYFEALALFAGMDDALIVLPGHGAPFTGPASRATDLRRHHDDRLAVLRDGLIQPATAAWAAHLLFPRAIAGPHARLALSETLSHLNHAVVSGRIERLEAEVPLYRRA